MVDFAKHLVEVSSINSVNQLVREIGNNKINYDELLKFCFSDNSKISMHASWVMMHYCKQNRVFIQDDLDFILTKINSSTNSSLKRNMLKIFAEYADFKKISNLGLLADICFRFFNNPSDAIAVRTFSLDVLMKLAKSEPEIIFEIKQSIEFHFNNYSRGLNNKAKKILKFIERNFPT